MAAPAPVPDRADEAREHLYALAAAYEGKRRRRSMGSLSAGDDMDRLRNEMSDLCRSYGLAFPWLEP